ncbi:hypothetical protein C900_02025 [Fulvivirga imtechensis AK7]|uniref:Uncharacterized protein n=1 Tax=Fulvivirga imtechensis AK7 TaxID=1237149 RepID=L8JT62_9BACT|nr:hypothetical protein [Fulvivirga imtechensis]ELR72030.1 hypothetical protein C900_02025 [Fulvivirga imtechensis AK7]
MYLYLEYKLSNIVRGGIIYCGGDTIAALILGEFTLIRMLTMLVVGSTIYAFEIPNYFRWIDKKTLTLSGLKKAQAKTGLALLYFNPLWVARHLFFIKVSMLQWNEIAVISLINIGFYSFLVNIPIAVIANYLIQNQVNLKWRFLASAIFSALMAIYYAMSAVWFS